MRFSARFPALGALLMSGALLAGCASNEPAPDLQEQELYQQAQSSLDAGRFSTAVTQLEALDTRFPFGRYAEQAQLEQIYAYYKVGELGAGARRRQPLHPSASGSSAGRLRLLHAWPGRLSGRTLQPRGLELIDISKRDLGASRDAYVDFGELVRRFPDSAYAPDARQRIIYLRNVMARHELQVADFTCARAPMSPRSSAGAG